MGDIQALAQYSGTNILFVILNQLSLSFTNWENVERKVAWGDGQAKTYIE